MVDERLTLAARCSSTGMSGSLAVRFGYVGHAKLGLRWYPPKMIADREG
jgi:hypothetical protein